MKFIIVILFFLFATLGIADNVTLHLNSGSIIVGEIQYWNGSNGTIKTDFGVISFEKKNLTQDSATLVGNLPLVGSDLQIKFKNGTTIKGTLISWDGVKGVLKTELGEITFSKDNVSEESLVVLKKIPPFSHPEATPLATATPTPTPLPTPADPVEYQKSAKYSVVIESFDNRGVGLAQGSGFIVNYKNKFYLFTNIHVLSGASTIVAKAINGRILKLGNFMVAADRDLAAFELPDEKEGVTILDNLDKNLMVNNEVAILGNSLGGRVTTEIRGNVLAIGPDLIETDAKFVHGNSGSPAIDVKTGKVVGIATYYDDHGVNSKDPANKDSKFSKEIRRFCWRIDNAEQWVPMNWYTFSQETSYIENEFLRNADLYNVIYPIVSQRVVPGNYRFKLRNTELEWTIQRYFKDIASMSESAASRNNRDQFITRVQALFASISSCCSIDNVRLNVDYIYGDRHSLNDIREFRQSLKDYLEKEAQILSSDPHFWVH